MADVVSAFQSWWGDLVRQNPPGWIEAFGVTILEVVISTVVGVFCYATSRDKGYREMVRGSAGLVSFNLVLRTLSHILMLQIYAWLCGDGASWQNVAFTRVSAEVPSVRKLLTQFALAICIFDVLFYSWHRMLHSPRLYRKIHSVHHTFEHRSKHRVPLAVYYVHPIEMLLLEMSVHLSCSLQGAHVLTYLFSGTMALLMALYGHSGRDLFGLMSHEHHHVRESKNYGATGMMDFLWGSFESRKAGKGPYMRVELCLRNEAS
ncbi:C-4 methylsterol oxidase [Rasamsonia emersonii CBS 393.64]|uniref:C-4 methylsterol oxidase n=1 Tax=Rasamsonia emersonii (strain ATCC 16479 / CBS 393.64 / IMI 116815) TaxID=1408163 RepID=A0A0F4YF30_RASE3|nr:C-4 methylsterol oxidase [Rasamsonia emersonii CBS 393.64]KKA16233.1 C-4 methylsterol oxidase [Rasamsonia emersonii CBS 393.64]